MYNKYKFLIMILDSDLSNGWDVITSRIPFLDLCLPLKWNWLHLNFFISLSISLSGLPEKP